MEDYAMARWLNLHARFFFLSFCCCCSALTEEDFYRILTVPTNNLIKQQVALLNTSVYRDAL